MRTYLFNITLEPDEEGWRAFYAPLEHLGASTWGATQEEAIENIREVLSMIAQEFAEKGEAIPVSDQLTVAKGG